MNLDSRPINYLHSLKIQEHSCIFNNRQKCIKWIESYSWRRKKKRIHFYREIFHYISRKLIISQRYSVSSALYNVHAYHNIYMIPHCQTEQKTRERRKAKIQYNIILPQVPSQVIFIINKLECNFFLCFLLLPVVQDVIKNYAIITENFSFCLRYGNINWRNYLDSWDSILWTIFLVNGFGEGEMLRFEKDIIYREIFLFGV